MRSALMLGVVVAGCATYDPVLEPDRDDRGEDQVVFSPPPPDQELQGTHLLGKYADQAVFGGEFLSGKPPNGYITIKVDNMVVKLTTGSGVDVPLAKNQELPTWRGSSFIKVVDVVPGQGYQLQYKDPVSGQYVDYCDSAESIFAIPMPGYWTAGRVHEDRGNAVTFACREDGKGASCITWGYVPENDPNARPLDSNYPMWDAHQSCVQMAMALYCGPGDVPHTRDKTPILIRDFLAGRAEPLNAGAFKLNETPNTYPPLLPPPDVFYYEAAFRPQQRVLCLNHMRWADFEPSSLCGGLVPDPRVDPDAEYCEEGPIDGDDTTVLVASKTMDLALHRWTSTSGTDITTTAHGYVGTDETRRRLKTRPPDGFVAPVGASDGYLLRNLTGTLIDDYAAGKLIRTYRMTNGTDTLLGYPGMLGLPNGYSYDTSADKDFEGFLFAGAQPNGETRPLYLWVNNAGTDYVTATTKPGNPYSKVQAAPIGHVIAGSL